VGSTSFDCYPYTRGSTVMTQLLPQRALEGGIDGFSGGWPTHSTAADRHGKRSVAWLRVGRASRFRRLARNGTNLSWSQPGRDSDQRHTPPVEAMLDLLVEERGDVNMLEINQSEENLREALCHPLSNVISDGFYVKGGPIRGCTGRFRTCSENSAATADG